MSTRIAESPALRDVIGTIARPVGADKLDDATFEEAINSCRTPCITRSAPAGWAATTPAWWIRSIRGHTHGPSVLIGDKATDLIRA